MSKTDIADELAHRLAGDTMSSRLRDLFYIQRPIVNGHFHPMVIIIGTSSATFVVSGLAFFTMRRLILPSALQRANHSLRRDTLSDESLLNAQLKHMGKARRKAYIEYLDKQPELKKWYQKLQVNPNSGNISSICRDSLISSVTVASFLTGGFTMESILGRTHWINFLSLGLLSGVPVFVKYKYYTTFVLTRHQLLRRYYLFIFLCTVYGVLYQYFGDSCYPHYEERRRRHLLSLIVDENTYKQPV